MRLHHEPEGHLVEFDEVSQYLPAGQKSICPRPSQMKPAPPLSDDLCGIGTWGAGEGGHGCKRLRFAHLRSDAVEACCTGGLCTDAARREKEGEEHTEAHAARGIVN